MEQAKAALTLAVERMKWYYDKKVQSVLFKVGNKVLLNLKDYQTTEQALQPQYEGPFEIIEKLSLVTFRLRMSPRYRALHPVFHASKLTQYSESTIRGQKATPPPPTLIQGQEEWEVEKILDLRQRHGKNEYLVRWKGYTQGDDTWEMQAKSCRNIFRVYHNQDNFSTELEPREGVISQTSFSHISINSPSILTVSMAMESPWKDLSISTSHVSRWSVIAEILGRSTGNCKGTPNLRLQSPFQSSRAIL